MSKQNFTIGMAGHIDHGKTELVKALTGIDTDRLKEEKERKISIELGYAPLIDNSDLSISIIDVPGHEKFIRQMIAGVTSTDLNLLIIAADEGVMPQTREHLEILNYLEIKHGVVVITKTDRVEQELVDIALEDIQNVINGTVFEENPIFQVDSITKKGIQSLKDYILSYLKEIPPKEPTPHLFLPVDQSFHLHGIGTVIRGTVVEGQATLNDEVYVQPGMNKVHIKSIHQFNQPVSSVSAGSRAALALKGVAVDDVKRGCVITNQSVNGASQRIDVELRISPQWSSEIKQRSPVKIHIHTSEVYGRIIFFDRNKLSQTDDKIYAQVELEEPVYAMKDQTFILRRATPIELIGGGKVINPQAEKHRFGEKTVQQLMQRATFDQCDLILDKVNRNPGVLKTDVINHFQIDEIESLLYNGKLIEIDSSLFSPDQIKETENLIQRTLSQFHKNHRLLMGYKKSQLISELIFDTNINKKIIDYFISIGRFKQKFDSLSLPEFNVKLTDNDKRLVNKVLKDLKEDGLQVKAIQAYFPSNVNIMDDFKHYLIQNEMIIDLTPDLYIEKSVFEENVNQIKHQTDSVFTLKDAKNILNVSRKYLIPFMEKLDSLNFTVRMDQERKWIK